MQNPKKMNNLTATIILLIVTHADKLTAVADISKQMISLQAIGDHRYRSAGNERTVAELIRELILNDKLDQKQERENTNQVNLMMLQGAKGPEFPHAVIVGIEDGILPHHVAVE